MSGLWRRAAAKSSLRPFVVLAAISLAVALLDRGQGRVLSVSTGYSVLQQFATVGPISLALGLSMMAGELDLSVGGILSLAGCIAVLTGVGNPYEGLALAVAAGAAAGAVQGAMITGLNLGSIGVTLGGLLTFGGVSYVLTGNTTIAYERMDVALAVNQPILGLLSLRSIVAMGLFLAAGLTISWTRVGRDLLAVGSNRGAATAVGLRVSWILIGVFTVSGAFTAIAGALLSYGLATASPVALADTLVPGIAAAILGGVSLSGGKGRPLGIAGGVLVLGVLRSSLTAIGVPPFVHWLVTAGVLLAVALFDSEELGRRLRWQWMGAASGSSG